MGWYDNFQDSNDQFQGAHQAKISHELLGGAVAYEAAKAYEQHCEANGKPVNHAKAKELLAAFSGAAIDRLVETKGLDAWDAHKRKQALDHAQGQLNETIITEQY